jgi:hypothetical protein
MEDQRVELVLGFGIAHKRSSFDDDYYGCHARENELPDVAESLIGAPVFLNHQFQREIIGNIVDSKVLDNGDLGVNFIVSGVTEDGRRTIQGMKDGKYRALSISMTTDCPRNDPTGLHEELTPYEVSICEVPGREGCNIQGFAHNNGNLYVFEKWEKFQILQNVDLTQLSFEEIDTICANNSNHKLQTQGSTSSSSSSSRIRIKPPKETIARILLEIENEKQKRKMADQQTISASGQQQNPRLRAILDEMKLNSEDELCDFLGNGLVEWKEEQRAKRQKVETEFKTKVLPRATDLQTDEKALNGLELGAKLLMCNAIGNVEAIELESSNKQKNLKETIDGMKLQMEGQSKVIAQLQEKLKLTGGANADPSARFGGPVMASGEAPAGAAAPVPPTVIPTGNVNTQEGVTLPPNMTIAAGGFQRKAGLVPRPIEPTCWEGGITKSNPKFNFGRLVGMAQGKDNKWSEAALLNTK